MAPAGASAWRPRANFGTPLTRFVPPRELLLWPQRARPQASPRPCRHAPHAFRAPHGASPMVPAGASTWHPRAPFGTPLTVRAPHGAPHIPAGASTLRPRAHFGIPLTRFVPPQGAPPMATAGASKLRPRANFDYPSRVSCPPGSSTNGPNGCVHISSPRRFRHTPHTFRGPIGSSTEGPSGCVRMASPRPLRHTMPLAPLWLPSALPEAPPLPRRITYE